MNAAAEMNLTHLTGAESLEQMVEFVCEDVLDTYEEEDFAEFKAARFEHFDEFVDEHLRSGVELVMYGAQLAGVPAAPGLERAVFTKVKEVFNQTRRAPLMREIIRRFALEKL